MSGNKNTPEEKRKENIESAKEFIGRWLIENSSIQGDASEAFHVLHYGFDADVAEKYTAKMMADFVNEKDMIIYGIEEGAAEWKREASDWKHKFRILADALTELVNVKELKEGSGETLEYLARKPKAWVTAKLLVEEIKKSTYEKNA